MIIYIVESLRWGERENHSYIVGCWDNLDAAKKVADEHSHYRGGKYQCIVQQCNLNNQMDSDWSATILYQTPMELLEP